MAHKITLLAITGETKTGKTPMSKLLEQLVIQGNHNKTIVHADFEKDIILWGEKLNEPLGRKIYIFSTQKTAGCELPEELATTLLEKWLTHTNTVNPNIRHLILNNFPRREKDVEVLFEFQRPFVVNIRGQSEPYPRPDDEFKTKTLPALSKLNGQVLHLDVSTPLFNRLDMLLKHLLDMDGRAPLKHQLYRKALGKLHKPEHEIHKHIRSAGQLPNFFAISRMDSEL